MSIFLARIDTIIPVRDLIEDVNDKAGLRYSIIEKYVEIPPFRCECLLTVLCSCRAQSGFNQLAHTDMEFYRPNTTEIAGYATDALSFKRLNRERAFFHYLIQVRSLRIHRSFLSESATATG